MYLTEEIMNQNPSMTSYTIMPSFDARQNILVSEIPKQGAQAAEKAIQEWGQSKSKRSHLIFWTNGGVNLPGADYRLSCLLGLSLSLRPSIGSCSEITIIITLFRGPTLRTSLAKPYLETAPQRCSLGLTRSPALNVSFFRPSFRGRRMWSPAS